MSRTTFKSSILAAAVACVASSAHAAVTWTQVYGQTSTTTRSLRGMALSSDGTSAYGTYIQGSSTSGVSRYTLSGSPPAGTSAGFFNVTSSSNGPSSDSHQAEAVTTDDRGIVYAASIKDSTSGDNARVYVLNATLGTSTKFALPDIDSPGSVTGETIGGLDLYKSGSTYQLYVTRFAASSAYIERYVVGGTGAGDATLTPDTTFDGDGRYNLRSVVGTADNLRGIDVAADGTIFVASREDNTVYRIASDLSGVSSTSVTKAMDLATFGGNVYVTQYNGAASNIVELSQATLASTGNTFGATGTFPHTEATSGYAGIDIDSIGRMYLSDQFYAGTSSNLSDRILVSSAVPEPTGVGAIALAGMALLARRGRRANSPH